MSSLRIVPLGGLGEVGMNCLALEQRGELIIIDCGVTFDDRGLGVDVVHPSFAPLEGYRIAGVFITHGHEDHIGALPYLLRRFEVPVWGPPYALGLVRERSVEHEILRHARLIETRPGKRFAVGSFSVEPIRVTHSIADATALAIETDIGVVVHSGDFKIDETPPDGELFDRARLSSLGDDGVALLFSDSTNIDAPGVSGSEADVGKALRAQIEGASGAVVVGMFASNVQRLRLLGEIAASVGRKIVLLGRSVSTHSRVARTLGYLPWPSDLVFPAERVRELPRSAILAIATGSQAEPNAALSRLARGEHSTFDLVPGDRVVFSSRIIPGHEPAVFGLMGDLLRRGLDVRTWISDRGVHASGHACRGEQRELLELVRPRAFVPVHGTLHHLTRHAELAREVGIRSVCILENGEVGEANGETVRRVDHIATGRVHVFAGRAIPDEVLRDRIAMAAEGVAFVIVPVDEAGSLAGDVVLRTKGIVAPADEGNLLAAAQREIRSALGSSGARGRTDDEAIVTAVRLAVRRALARLIGYKPGVVVQLSRSH